MKITPYIFKNSNCQEEYLQFMLYQTSLYTLKDLDDLFQYNKISVLKWYRIIELYLEIATYNYDNPIKLSKKFFKVIKQVADISTAPKMFCFMQLFELCLSNKDYQELFVKSLEFKECIQAQVIYQMFQKHLDKSFIDAWLFSKLINKEDFIYANIKG